MRECENVKIRVYLLADCMALCSFSSLNGIPVMYHAESEEYAGLTDRIIPLRSPCSLLAKKH
jgi:hypothetical protein